MYFNCQRFAWPCPNMQFNHFVNTYICIQTNPMRIMPCEFRPHISANSKELKKGKDMHLDMPQQCNCFVQSPNTSNFTQKNEWCRLIFSINLHGHAQYWLSANLQLDTRTRGPGKIPWTRDEVETSKHLDFMQGWWKATCYSTTFIPFFMLPMLLNLTQSVKNKDDCCFANSSSPIWTCIFEVWCSVLLKFDVLFLLILCWGSGSCWHAPVHAAGSLGPVYWAIFGWTRGTPWHQGHQNPTCCRSQFELCFLAAVGKGIPKQGMVDGKEWWETV